MPNFRPIVYFLCTILVGVVLVLVLVLVLVFVVVLVVVTGGKQSQLLVPRLKSGLWT